MGNTTIQPTRHNDNVVVDELRAIRRELVALREERARLNRLIAEFIDLKFPYGDGAYVPRRRWSRVR